jgi:hypothetical protein
MEMKEWPVRPVFTALVLAMAAGCSGDAVQRSAYEAVQGASQRDCRQYPSVECPRREGYDDYRRQRKELEK